MKVRLGSKLGPRCKLGSIHNARETHSSLQVSFGGEENAEDTTLESRNVLHY